MNLFLNLVLQIEPDTVAGLRLAGQQRDPLVTITSMAGSHSIPCNHMTNKKGIKG
jgi:hypothetical protein